MNISNRRLLACLLLAGLLTACGQRGPLYLPGEEGEKKDRPRAPGDSPFEREEF